MRNCLVLGSGRSGTSMVGGVLSGAGYFMDDRPYSANDGNPKGYYEDEEVNLVNEAILEQIPSLRTVGPAWPWWLRRWLVPRNPVQGQRWLVSLPVETTIARYPAVEARIVALTGRVPFCFKDPRFSYTLPAWRPFLTDTVFVCVFRHPADTVTSMLRECSQRRYLWSLAMSLDLGLQCWTAMYRHILDRHRHEGRWLFLHYEQVLTDAGLDRLSAFVEAPVDRRFPDAALRRSSSALTVPEVTLFAYRELCELAGYGPPVRADAARAAESPR